MLLSLLPPHVWRHRGSVNLLGSLPLHSLFISFSEIQITSSYFHQHSASAYHQEADQDKTTHAYTIGLEMTVSKSMVKPSLINVGMMNAKLSLWGISSLWHLHCLCWDLSQKSRTPRNMLARILQFCDFLSRVNNAICWEIFIHWQSKGKLMPLVRNIRCIYFLSAFSITLWINVPQFGRWTVTSSFSINVLHLLYPSLYLQ